MKPLARNHLRACLLVPHLQGLRCWVNLASNSSGGSLLGAVELAVCLSELAGVSAGSAGSGATPQDEPPLLLCPQAAALVPPALRGTLLLPPGSGFSGQLAVLALHLDQLVPSASSRPKADRHFCSYRLPWALPAASCAAGVSGSASDGAITTASRVLTAVGGCSAGGAGAGVVAFGSGGGSRRGSGAGGGAAGAGVPLRQHWAANMRHSGYFEVRFRGLFAHTQRERMCSSAPCRAGQGGAGWGRCFTDGFCKGEMGSTHC